MYAKNSLPQTWKHGIPSSFNLFLYVICHVSGPKLLEFPSLLHVFSRKVSRMSNRRSQLVEMTALWLIPIFSVVIAASSGGLIAKALESPQHKIWTLVIRYVFWGIWTPLSWLIITFYFPRLTVHEPLPREATVSSMLPIEPLALSGYSYVVRKASGDINYCLC
jgi:tellurite resistance protein TehA-like permease